MKNTLLLLILTLINFAYSQTISEFTLSNDIPETRLGIWEKGDYKSLIEIDALTINFKNAVAGYSKYIEYTYTDSLSRLFYNQMITRYNVAIEQLEKAKNNYDLKNIVLYYGLDDAERNKEKSVIVEENVMQFVKYGKAIVYYKGDRIYTLKSKTILTGDEILNRGYETKVYYNNPDNCINIYYYHLGW
jgi:hypothetical protein